MFGTGTAAGIGLTSCLFFLCRIAVPAMPRLALFRIHWCPPVDCNISLCLHRPGRLIILGTRRSAEAIAGTAVRACSVALAELCAGSEHPVCAHPPGLLFGRRYDATVAGPCV